MNIVRTRTFRVAGWAMLILLGAAAGPRTCAADTKNPGSSQTMEGGRGLLLMESARTMGKSSYSFGLRGLYQRREYPVSWKSSPVIDNTMIGALPVTIGLTDEVDVSGTAYFFGDGRPYLNNLTYGTPATGLGSSRIGVKIRFPFNQERSVQIAAKLGALFGTSEKQIDGLDYRWTRNKGIDIEGSLLQTLDLGKSLSLHFEEGYVLSDSKVYADQWMGAAGIDIHPSNRLTIGLEANNRTFDGCGPQSVFQYNIGNPYSVVDKKADRMKDYFVVAPSLQYRITDTVALDIGAVINIADQAEPKETVQIAAGITVNGMVRSLLDTDRDGVNDTRDREPNTPRNYPVDVYGVALDSDKDGVPDGADREQNTPRGAIIDFRGVSMDTDGDGVPDGIDRELNTPKGCPVDRFGVALDDDGDGVPNSLDKEPNTPQGTPVDKNGVALDDDGDGVSNYRDKEPNTPRGYPVDKNGVALDDDGDGIPNGKDLEPDTPKGSVVDQFGRALKEQERVLVQEGFIRLSKVYFEIGKSKLTVESYDALNAVTELLLKYPMLRIEIQGHTDNSGSRMKNIQLSQARAQAVLEYILTHEPSLKRDNFTVVGYGPDRPIAPNITAEGKRLNRRVEFVVLNKEELQKIYPKK